MNKIALFFILLLPFDFTALAQAAGHTHKVSLDELAPLQTDVGFAAAHLKGQLWVEKARLLALMKKTTLRKELVQILKEECNSGVDAYVSPDRKIRPVDGHHQMVAVREVMDLYSIPHEQVKLRVTIDVENDFSHRTWSEFAAELERKQIGYFSPQILEESILARETLGERYERHLGKSFAELHDSPMRSAMNGVFRTLGFNGATFKPGAQLLLGDEFEQSGIHVQAGVEFSPVTQKILLQSLFQSEVSRALEAKFVSLALPEQDDFVKNTFRQAERRILPGLNSHSIETAEISCNTLLKNGGYLPNSFSFPNAPSEYLALFQAAEAGASEMNVAQIRSLLNRILEQKRPDLGRPEIQFLRDSRKTTLKLRSAFKLLSSSHQAPEPFRNFVRTFGYLNDVIRKWDLSKKPPPCLRATAKKLTKMLNNQSNVSAFEPSSEAAFQFYQQKVTQELEQMLIDEQNGKLTVDAYHDLRKTIRDYQFLFELIAAKAWSIEADGILEELKVLSKRLGVVKDGLVDEADLKGKDLNKAKTKIDAESKTEIKLFLAMLRQSVFKKSNAQ